jgi:hypothetical protein
MSNGTRHAADETALASASSWVELQVWAIGAGSVGRLSQNRTFLRQPPLPRHQLPITCSGPVSEINVAQPPLSQGSATLPRMGHLLGYARVSTTDQQPHLQVDALIAAGCYRVFTETASGARTVRPTLEQLLDQLRPGDTLVVWKLDRLGRSLRHLVDTIIGLAEGGIGFRRLQEAIDTTTPGGKLVFHVFAAWPSSNATSSANAPPPGWRQPGPAAATAAGLRS